VSAFVTSHRVVSQMTRNRISKIFALVVKQMEDGLRYFSPVRNDGNRVAGADFHHPAHLRLLGRLVTLCGPDPGRRWEPLRDDVSGRNQRRWHGLQNHPKRHPEDPLQLLLPKWVRGWERSIRGAGPSW
jgi:hypothetical protein